MDLLVELARQVPSLLVLVWLVKQFLAHMRQTNSVIHENTRIIAKAAQILEHFEEANGAKHEKDGQGGQAA